MKIIESIFGLTLTFALGAFTGLHSIPVFILWLFFVCIFSLELIVEILRILTNIREEGQVYYSEDEVEEWTVNHSIEDFQIALTEDDTLREYFHEQFAETVRTTLEGCSPSVKKNNYLVAHLCADNLLNKFTGEETK